MVLRDCLVRWGILTSRRVLALKPAAQLFFRNLLHVCDGAGRFEADADMLRSVLYGLILDKIQRGDVSRWMAECHLAGLVKLYTVSGRGYGKVINYGQRDYGRKVLYPDEDSDQLNFAGIAADGSELARPSEAHRPKRAVSRPSAASPPVAGIAHDAGGTARALSSGIEGKRREGRGSARGAPAPAPDQGQDESEEEWIDRLQSTRPDIDVRAQLRLAEAAKRKQGRGLERGWFQDHWLPKATPQVGTVETAAATPAPEGWQQWVDEHMPEEDDRAYGVVRGALDTDQFSRLPKSWQAKIRRELGS